MKERGVSFKGAMVQALLEGRKTQTRRLVKMQPVSKQQELRKCDDGYFRWWLRGAKTCQPGRVTSPFGMPGDRLWVRETWGVVSHDLDEGGNITAWVPDRPATAIHEMPFGNGYYSGHAIYAADGGFTWGDDDGAVDGRSCWKPSIFMPRSVSRILLEITNVRAERLGEISERDVLREGICQLPFSGRFCLQPGMQYFGAASHNATEVYSWLWEMMNGKDSWNPDAWVWVIDVKCISVEAKCAGSNRATSPA
ncbi:hypothetical protein EDF88_4539 [Buttiauxella sp. BIGb0552]|uniref:hypothetical protein n=1 Tax=Buttiauxella sp. BIGb0552 TaxID=2485120 RepID=UPI0010660A3C|nr:hypothetical protein [Buttiauxella sp. BIGb0552]TDX11941.1 hypothetical protein EDF88_4539 [Buttiauxella sp. BIGb0552]